MQYYQKIFLVFIFFSKFVYSYDFTNDFDRGTFWQSFPVPFKVIETDIVEYERLQQLTTDAVQDWLSSLIIPIEVWNLLQTNGAGDSLQENHIRFAQNFAMETGNVYNPISTLAVTIRHSRAPLYVRTEIILNPNAPELKDDQFLKAVIMHELGHTVGLDHSEYPGALMYAYLDQNTGPLFDDDIQGFNAVIEETKKRQANPSVQLLSPLSRESNESKPLSCATIDIQQGNGPKGGLASLVLGIFLMSFLLSFKRFLPDITG